MVFGSCGGGKSGFRRIDSQLDRLLIGLLSQLGEQITKNPDSVFPRTFSLVATLADEGDAVARGILAGAAVSLAGLVECVASELGWRDREVPVAKVGGANGRSKYFDAAIDAELKKSVPRVVSVPVEMSPAEAAVRMAVRLGNAKGNAA